jgi:hypothetical protein
MLNEIIAFILGFITAFILFAIIGYRQKKKLEQQIKIFDIDMIKQLIEKSKEAEQINWEEEERKRDLEIGKDLKKKLKVEKNES